MATETHKVAAQYDGILIISTARSRKSKTWKAQSVFWSGLVYDLSKTKRTEERHADYLAMPKEEQDSIKDVGGFVGGTVNNGRRTAENMGTRQLITLDADFAPARFWEIVKEELSSACCIYSTHKHSKENPRYRLVVPLDRAVTPDEYQAVCRMLASDIGIDYFDDTTYQPHRLMYKPSTSSDGVYEFQWQDGQWLSADKMLARYTDWHDQTGWPVSSRQARLINKEIKKQQNPTEKEGLLGAFCRTYSIAEAIAEFLPDVYEECAAPGRYTFRNGSTVGGAVVYEDMFLYSHHATDPCSMHLVNAFDLVRLHKFGEMDEGHNPSDTRKLPSYKAMMDFAGKDTKVKMLIHKERMAEISEEFTKLEPEDNLEWATKLKLDNSGVAYATRYNIRLVLENDPAIRGTFAWDSFSHRIAMVGRPVWRSEGDMKEEKFWTDADETQLRYHMETVYQIDSKQKVEDEVLNVANMNAFHPVRKYLQGLKWDGLPRVDRLFIDCLGAEDTPYVRAATRMMCLAGVARIMVPGIKFDNMIILVGRQGLGKSYILKLLGHDWFSDSLTTVQGKEAFDQIRGKWINEIPELASMRKSENEAIKAFISKQEDHFRLPYGRHPEDFPRQGIFVGTTNESTFLRDVTGNRRFFPITCGVSEPSVDLWGSGIEAYIDQVWAEAFTAFMGGEEINLPKALQEEAEAMQSAYTDVSPLVGMIQEFLDIEIPANWYKLPMETRRDFIKGNTFEIDMSGAGPRMKVCPLEVWCEMMGGDIKHFDNRQRKEIKEALAAIPGWESSSKSGRALSFGKPYGVQRAFTRSNSVYGQQTKLQGARADLY